MDRSLLKHPSAFLPVLMSLSGLTLLLVHIAIYGIVHEVDEGTPAHIFQLLMVLQLPIIAYFTVKWLPRSPVNGIFVLLIQAAAALLALAAVFLFT